MNAQAINLRSPAFIYRFMEQENEQKHIHLISKDKYNEKLALAEDILKDIDITDSPFLALALTLNCSIWSNDGHFKRQNKAGVYTTKDLTGTIDL